MSDQHRGKIDRMIAAWVAAHGLEAQVIDKGMFLDGSIEIIVKRGRCFAGVTLDPRAQMELSRVPGSEARILEMLLKRLEQEEAKSSPAEKPAPPQLNWRT